VLVAGCSPTPDDRPPGEVLHLPGEIYDAGADTWTLTAPMHTGRVRCAALPLSDGRVLVQGGVSRGSALVWEIYDLAADTWAVMPPPTGIWVTGELVVLPDGRVLAITDDQDFRSGRRFVEVYDPGAGHWTTHTGRSVTAVQSIALLSDGRVLVAGFERMGVAGVSGQPRSTTLLPTPGQPPARRRRYGLMTPPK
jgi:hypothetical protein